MSLAIEEIHQKFLETTGICTDTRKITSDCMFVALVGANFDANEFAAEALKNGAKYVLVERVVMPEDFYSAYKNQIIEVKDTLKALQDLANHHRKTFQIPFIAVCGSNGKTTSKELIYRVLSQKYKAFATQGNLNNHIGVPLTLLSIPKETEIAVIEIGANHEGETRQLCEIAEPTCGLITNVGLDHLEGFGSIEGVKRANSEVFDWLASCGGKAFVNMEDDVVLGLANQYFEDFVGFSSNIHSKNAFYKAELLESDFFVQFKAENGSIVKTQLFGNYNFDNILTALCIGKYFEVEENAALEAVANYAPSNNRSQVIKKNNNTILMDAYNANPSSMALALENFAKIKHQPKIIILGDMFELGEASASEHQKIGELIAKLGFDMVVLFGQAMKNALIANPKAYYFTDKFSIHNWLKDKKIQDAHILIKGSRGIALETVLQFIG